MSSCGQSDRSMFRLFLLIFYFIVWKSVPSELLRALDWLYIWNIYVWNPSKEVNHLTSGDKTWDHPVTSCHWAATEVLTRELSSSPSSGRFLLKMRSKFSNFRELRWIQWFKILGFTMQVFCLNYTRSLLLIGGSLNSVCRRYTQ